MGYSGTVRFQSNDCKDIFHVADVFEGGVEMPDTEFMGVEEFDNTLEWVTGNIARMVPVIIDGDTTVIHGWFRGENYDQAFTLTVYVEYEEAEELVSTGGDKKIDVGSSDDINMEPQEINL
jgi:hypothetical protein